MSHSVKLLHAESLKTNENLIGSTYHEKYLGLAEGDLS